jgi:hypothetical protein
MKLEAPTPWTVDSDECLKVKDADGATVATVSQITLRKRRHASETREIASLIAAAPDLLRCLRNITDLYEELQGHPTAYSYEARAALSKASPGRKGNERRTDSRLR